MLYNIRVYLYLCMIMKKRVCRCSQAVTWLALTVEENGIDLYIVTRTEITTEGLTQDKTRRNHSSFMAVDQCRLYFVCCLRQVTAYIQVHYVQLQRKLVAWSKDFLDVVWPLISFLSLCLIIWISLFYFVAGTVRNNFTALCFVIKMFFDSSGAGKHTHVDKIACVSCLRKLKIQLLVTCMI